MEVFIVYYPSLPYSALTYDGDNDCDQYIVWGYSSLSVGIISLSGLGGGLLWPVMKTRWYGQLMCILIGLAVGSLTSSATFQLIPEGFKIKNPSNDHLNTAVPMWFSFWALFMFEALSKILFHDQQADNQQNSSDDGTIAERSHEALELDGYVPVICNKNNLQQANGHLSLSRGSLHKAVPKNSLHSHSDGKMAPVAWMIIIGDGIHNFIDGMSIGAGFSRSITTGTSISLAIACEEFPHELGDFAILINSGMSIKKALLFNFLSACTAFGGLIVGILLGEVNASVYIFAFAGGLFLYIALTDLMPELNQMIARGLETSKKTALHVLLLQNVGIFSGATILYLVTKFLT